MREDRAEKGISKNTMINSESTTQKTIATNAKTVRAKKVTPKKTEPDAKKATQSRKAPKALETPKGGRPGSKSAMILNLIRRPAGASLAAIMKATGWQAHSVRGFLSTAPNKYHVKIESTKTGAGQRVYRITK